MSVAGVCGAGSCAAAQQATDCGSKASMAATRVDGSAAGEETSGSGRVGRTDGGDGTRAHEGHHGHRGHHVHHGRHGHRGQGLVNVIRQVLQDLLGETGDPAPAGDTTDTAVDALDAVDALEGDAVTVDAAAAGPVAGETEGTETVEGPAEVSAGEAAATDPVATADPGAESAPASRFAVKHALYAFLHTLFSTIAQGHTAAPAPEATDGEGGTEPAAPGPPAALAGYRNSGPGLDGLVAGLASDGASDGTSDGTGAGMDLTALRASFDFLVGTVGGEAAVGTVTLQSFLEALLAQLGGSAPASDPVPPAGGLVTVTA